MLIQSSEQVRSSFQRSKGLSDWDTEQLRIYTCCMDGQLRRRWVDVLIFVSGWQFDTLSEPFRLCSEKSKTGLRNECGVVSTTDDDGEPGNAPTLRGQSEFTGQQNPRSNTMGDTERLRDDPGTRRGRAMSPTASRSDGGPQKRAKRARYVLRAW
ncbi:hypothetical protein ANO11243_071360 [Dothideomycetidae sp. 11243]|nr:hypothetical protein ANO11243_071360 [fungal sp. No.11243]